MSTCQYMFRQTVKQEVYCQHCMQLKVLVLNLCQILDMPDGLEPCVEHWEQ